MTNSELLRGHGLPRFEAIDASQVKAHIPALIHDLGEQLSTLESTLQQRLADNTPLSWNEVMTPLHLLGERLRWSWGVVSHLNGVCNSPELREAHSAQQPDVVRFSNRAGQSQVIHQALESLQQNPSHPLDSTQIRILNAELLSMRHRGVGLSGADQKSFNDASEQLASLSTRFSNHVLDATQGWTLLVQDADQIKGIPERALKALAAAAKEAGDQHRDGKDPTALEGPWRLGLDMPRYLPVLTHADNRNLRETVYRAQVSRASSGELDNTPLIEQILDLRTHQAARLGYQNWAERSLASKMADNVEAVERLLEELRVAALPIAEQEMDELRDCARRHGAKEADDFSPWDVSYWAEKLRQERFNLNQEELRPFLRPGFVRPSFDSQGVQPDGCVGQGSPR